MMPPHLIQREIETVVVIAALLAMAHAAQSPPARRIGIIAAPDAAGHNAVVVRVVHSEGHPRPYAHAAQFLNPDGVQIDALPHEQIIPHPEIAGLKIDRLAVFRFLQVLVARRLPDFGRRVRQLRVHIEYEIGGLRAAQAADIIARVPLGRLAEAIALVIQPRHAALKIVVDKQAAHLCHPSRYSSK